MSKPTFIDLFAGIGGIRLGLEQAGLTCAFSNDFDPHAKITYDLNFKQSLIDHELTLADLGTLNPQDFPDTDVLCGGFPCQPFSVAGYRKGFEDEGRGNLFFTIAKILKTKRPKAFLLENVKNLKTHDKGKTLRIIYETLEVLGYHAKDQVLNTLDHGNLPQNRERIYIVGFLDQTACETFEFPKPIKRTTTIHSCLEQTQVDDMYYYEGKPLHEKLVGEVTNPNTIYQWRRKYVRANKNQVCPTLTANMSMGGHNVPIIKDAFGIRKLTPRECANFQGFPTSYQLPKIPNSYLYKQFGNSVSVPVVRRIAEQMMKVL